MPRVTKRVRLVNPSVRRHKKATAVAKKMGVGRKKNPSWKLHKKVSKAKGNYKRAAESRFRTALAFKKHLGFTSTTRRKKRLPNVGQILAVTPLMNPRSRSKKFGSKAGFLSHWQTKSNRKIRKARKKGNSIQATYYGDTQWVRSYGKRKANPNSVTMAKRKTRRKRVGVNQYGMPALGYRKRLRYAGRAKRG